MDGEQCDRVPTSGGGAGHCDVYGEIEGGESKCMSKSEETIVGKNPQEETFS